MTNLSEKEIKENQRQVAKLMKTLGGPGTTQRHDEVRHRLGRLRPSTYGSCADCDERGERVVYNDLLLCGACAESRIRVAVRVGVK